MQNNFYSTNMNILIAAVVACMGSGFPFTSAFGANSSSSKTIVVASTTIAIPSNYSYLNGGTLQLTSAQLSSTAPSCTINNMMCTLVPALQFNSRSESEQTDPSTGQPIPYTGYLTFAYLPAAGSKVPKMLCSCGFNFSTNTVSGFICN